MATLIGVAERDKKLATSELMGKYIPEWAKDGKTNTIQMEHVMRHCSGRYYDPATDFVTPQLQTDQTNFAIHLSQQHPPGTHDQYNQMAYQTLQQVFERAYGLGIQAAAQRELYGPMQFESKTYWQMHGFFTGVPQKHPLVYGGVTTSCADMARFGHLWLNKGLWRNHTVFTLDFWNKAMSQPVYPFGPGRRYGNWGTGEDCRSMGFGKQIVMFNLKTQLVVTRIGGVASIDFDYNEYFKMLDGAIKDPEERGNDSDWIIGVA
jgi:CubicO group peptidase (beta-lactamase class C family)